MDNIAVTRLRAISITVVALALAFKFVLLNTSHSMVDGDEAVTGLMALSIFENGLHPIYPYGVRYGAGAGIEAHIAALLFQFFGVSDPVLKAAGLPIWAASGVLLFVIARRYGGERLAWLSVVLFAVAPASVHWSIKVAGGHGVGLALALVALLLSEQGKYRASVVVLPLAVLAHPHVFSVCLAIGIAAYYFAAPNQRLQVVACFVASLCASLWVLWPDQHSIWNPTANNVSVAASLQALPGSIINLFTPHLSADFWPSGYTLASAVVWLIVFVVALPGIKERRYLFYVLSAFGMAFVINPERLAARHLLILYPLACLLIAMFLSRLRFGHYAYLLLVTLAVGLHLREPLSPNIYGAGVQARGFDRQLAQNLIGELQTAGISHVYSGDPMFQWNIVFATRGRIVARSLNPVGRIPAYAQRVDTARAAGYPVAVILQERATAGKSQLFVWTEVSGSHAEEQARIDALFPRSPSL